MIRGIRQLQVSAAAVRALATTSRYATKSKRLENPALKKKPYNFSGKQPALKLPEAEKVKRLHELTGKIHDFNALKLLPEVRACLIDEIKRSTILRAQNHLDTTKKTKNESELNGLIVRPTPIQIAAIKAIQATRKVDECKVFTLAAETGSGKTWAYLAPLLDALKRDEKDAELWTKLEKRQAIRSVILVPTHELVDQVYETMTKLKIEPLNVYKWDTNSNFKDFMQNYKNRIDIMVTTPAKLFSLGQYDDVGSLSALMHGVRYCAVDEADTLMDKSWVETTYKTIRTMKKLETLVFASATFPAEFNTAMAKLFPDSTPVTTPALHRLPKAIDFKTINASLPPFKGSKMKLLAQVLYAIYWDGSEPGFEKRVIVFVNEKSDVPKIATKLRETYKHQVYHLSGDNTAEERHEMIKDFVSPPKALNDENEKAIKVLVCTDLLARGMNFAGIRNVILYDVPKTTIDLVHRVGRTGRMNQSGRVYMFVTNKDRSQPGLPKAIKLGRAMV